MVFLRNLVYIIIIHVLKSGAFCCNLNEFWFRNPSGLTKIKSSRLLHFPPQRGRLTPLCSPPHMRYPNAPLADPLSANVDQEQITVCAKIFLLQKKSLLLLSSRSSSLACGVVSPTAKAELKFMQGCSGTFSHSFLFLFRKGL